MDSTIILKPLTSSFFARDTLVGARELLGKIIQINGMSARIVETEAYKQDKASHAYIKTPRSAIMYDTYGQVYVYLVYGMYHCLNFTTESVGEPGAVLIRAVEPLRGMEQMKINRKCNYLHNLCSGPGKLCQALGITTALNATLVGTELKVYDNFEAVSDVGRSSRIGITADKHLKWRFFIKNSRFVSQT